MNGKVYKDVIARLIDDFPLPIDKNVVIDGRPPTATNSEFLTNKEQGDWAERLVVKAINESSCGYVAVPYGRSDSIAAGDKGFAEFYRAYQNELNTLGKKPDILLFQNCNVPRSDAELSSSECVSRAVAAIEVRSSSFLCEKYKSAMSERITEAERRCAELRDVILSEPYGNLLKSKNPAVYGMLSTATEDTFRELTFRAVSWSSSDMLMRLSALIISFERILSLCSDSQNEGRDFSVETDVKNQGKTTIKVNIDAGEPIIGKIDMPSHFSAMKELDRGRLLFYVKFEGGQGYLDMDVFRKTLVP